MLEIRGHARGGQGMVTAFEIMAKIISKMGDFRVQAFPAFGVERTGAPIQAFLRAGKKEILNRSNIYEPHLVVVFDESLLSQVPVFGGLQEGGVALINTESAAASGQTHLTYTVPATKISLEHALGSRSLPIVNAAMIGAMARILDIDPQLGQEVVRQEAPAKAEANARAFLDAYYSIKGAEAPNTFLIQLLDAAPTEKKPAVLAEAAIPSPATWEAPVIPAWSSPLSQNKTGNWRVMTPVHLTRTPPCNVSCPAGTDVRAFIKFAGEKKYEEALRLIYQHNPFPAICGRVCPHFCEQQCNRNAFDSGVNVGAVERFLGDRAAALPSPPPEPLHYEEKIAVIGSGPAGLTAALRLRQKGYAVTVFEALPLAGGMMRSGIPKFRLPDEVLDAEIRRITAQGVDIRLNARVQIEALKPQYQAVVVAVGSHVSSDPGLQGDPGLVGQGIEFLRRFKLDQYDGGIRPGDQAAVIGGGNTAIDVARTLLRLGAKPTVFYRRTYKEMPAIAQELEEARHEGVNFQMLSAPVSVRRDKDGRIALTMTEMALGEPDASGRRRPVPVPGSEYDVFTDHVIAAIGQRFDPFAFSGQAIRPQQGKVAYPAEIPVFCAGDMAWGGTVVEAIGSGNKVAEEVHAALRGQPYHPEDTLPEVVLPKDINLNYYLPTPRHHGAVLTPRDLQGDFSEINQGLGEMDITAESARCLHCGDCFNCGNCFNYCPDAAIFVDEDGRLRIDYDYCKGCGICVQECPCSAIEIRLAEQV